MDWLPALVHAFVQAMTAIVNDGTALAQAVLAFLTAITGIVGAVAALRGRARKTPAGKPVPVATGTPARERNARLPELRELRQRQERLLFRNNLAGVVLLPIAIFAAAVYLILFAFLVGQDGRPVAAAGAIVVTVAMAVCWLLQRNLNPQWRAKQAFARIAHLSDSINEVEAEIRRDTKSADRIKDIGIERVNQAQAEERDDIAIGV